MRRFVLDTGVVGAYLRNAPIWQRMAADHRLLEDDAMRIVSVVSWGELFSIAQINQRGQPKQRKLSSLLETLYVVDIAHADEQLIADYCTLDAFSRNALQHKPLPNGSRKMGKNDLWIGATAKTAQAELITMDGDFDHLHGHYLTVHKYPPK